MAQEAIHSSHQMADLRLVLPLGHLCQLHNSGHVRRQARSSCSTGSMYGSIEDQALFD